MRGEAREFKILDSGLDGVNLIEASAGTGKTYTLAALYLRFVLEQELHPEAILVVTFTEAATRELRDRIRRRLREALNALAAGTSSDPFLDGLAARQTGGGKATELLTTALRDFDQSAIFTIHGFCRRVLQENAFESGSLFDTELITDQDALKREVIEDFWRKELYGASPLVVYHLLKSGLSPHALVRSYARGVMASEIAILPRVARPSLEELRRLEDTLTKSVLRLVDDWPDQRSTVRELLLHASLHATYYGSKDKHDPSRGMTAREATVFGFFEEMDGYVESHPSEMPLPLPDAFRFFTTSEIIARTTGKPKVPPAHDLFDLCEIIRAASDGIRDWALQYLSFLKVEAFHVLNRDLPDRKRQRNVQHFDDLLLRVAQGLKETGGDELASAVRKRYRVALIDEFQDTDVVQYAIFSTLFGTPDRSLFLIGDPKQAIYAFRGADVFAYMEAARRAQNAYTLSTNRRSEAGLIAGVNTLFVGHPHAFVYPEIAFRPAAPPPDRIPDPLMIEGSTACPVEIWYFEDPAAPETTEKTGRKSPAGFNRRDAEELIVRAVSTEITRLLRLSADGMASIAGRPVRESDLAVLVRRRSEAQKVQRALARLRIPSVLHSEDDVFESPEAAEMHRLMAGIAEPHRERLVRGALATQLLGVNGATLFTLTTDDSLWEAWLLKFAEWLKLWQDHGFMRMFRQLMVEQKVRGRLVSLSGGERRITNVLHIVEILHQQSLELGLGPAELVKWIADRRNPDIERSEIHPLRLESDENAVRIVTIHKSKGLQYPIVFCPFCWGASDLHDPKGGFSFHDERDRRRLTLCFDAAEIEARAMAEKESLAENVRLLYVALTRAQKRAYLVHGSFSGVETSSLAYLFHTLDSKDGPPGSLNDLRSLCAALPREERIDQLRAIAERSGGTVQLVLNPPGQPEEYRARADSRESLRCRKFRGHIDRTWRVSSFSSLTSGSLTEGELPDRDSLTPDVQPTAPAAPSDDIEQERLDIFTFPAGTRSGLLIHSVLEQLDFANPDPSVLRHLIVRKCAEYGFASKWHETLSSAIQNLLSVRLGYGGASFPLSRVGLPDRLTELEFTYPLARLDQEELASVLARHASAATADADSGSASPLSAHGRLSWSRLQFQPVTGFMKGFMDLVFRFEDRFYLIDWKTNYLGDQLRSYDRSSMEAAMHHSHYHLQALLYTVALDRYFSLRLPGYNYEAHFGEVYYLFVRGIDPGGSDASGVYSLRPPRELIRELNGLFSPQGPTGERDRG
ncbi:MAG: exodeoxyribonuclease V subunit beta [Syntrophobacteraceae bacterium]